MVRYMRWIYAVAAWLLAGAIVIQFLLAGIGVFAPDNFCDLTSSNTIGCGFTPHAAWAVVVLFPLFLLVLLFSFASRVPWRTTGLSAGLLGLFVLQGLLIWPYDGPPALKPLSALHVVNGLLVLFLALHVAGRAGELIPRASGSGKQVPSAIVVRPAEAKGD